MNYYAWYPATSAHYFQAMPPSYYPYYGKKPMMTQTVFASKKKASNGPPRPAIVVPPRSIGPIYHPNESDVLAGRGGRINSHIGNIRFRKIVAMHKADYIAKSTKKFEKAHIAASIVQQIRSMNPPGRFLKEEPDGSWFDIGDHKAIKKVGQALREDAPDAREEMECGSKKSSSDNKPCGPKGETKCEQCRADACEPIIMTIHRTPLRDENESFLTAPTKLRMEQLGGTGKSKSAAVMAALEGSGEIAFGRVFYPPPSMDDMEVSTTNDGSLISGLSALSRLSSSVLDHRHQPCRQHTYSGEFMGKAKAETSSFKAPSSLVGMSATSSSISFSPSLLSDLSEGFTAMDISEPLPLDHLL